MLCAAGIYGIHKYGRQAGMETISVKDALADYDYMWNILEENYPLFNVAKRKYGLSAEAIKENYREQILACEGKRIDFCEYYELMQACVGTFRRLGHLSIYTPYAYQTRLEELHAEEQSNPLSELGKWRMQLFNNPLTRKRYEYLAEKYGNSQVSPNTVNSPNLTFQDIDADTAYVKINSFMTSNILSDQTALNDWFAANSHKRNIILDITGNTGGNDAYWRELLVAPNIQEELNYTSYYITSYGKDTREQFALCGVEPEDLNPDLAELLELPGFNGDDLSEVNYYKTRLVSVFPSRKEKLCQGRFFLLVDNSVSSAAEGFAMFCKATGFATVVGENTRGDGGGGNVFDIRLPKSGLLIMFRAMHSLNPDGSSNVEFGTTPDVVYSGKRGSKDVSFLGICLDYIDSMDD